MSTLRELEAFALNAHRNQMGHGSFLVEVATRMGRLDLARCESHTLLDRLFDIWRRGDGTTRPSHRATAKA